MFVKHSLYLPVVSSNITLTSQGHCVVFLGKTLYSSNASLQPNGYQQI